MNKFLKRIFCKHDLKTIKKNRYNVIRKDGSKEGEVTLFIIKCSKCDYESLLSLDRVHMP